MKTIGIIGGMGPEATALFYKKIIRIFQNYYSAKYDSDYPKIIIYNVPIPDVVENCTQEEIIKSMLISASKKLESIGADYIVIPCNTVPEVHRPGKKAQDSAASPSSDIPTK